MPIDKGEGSHHDADPHPRKIKKNKMISKNSSNQAAERVKHRSVDKATHDPDRIRFTKTITDPSTFVPLLASEFKNHLPWLNLWWGLTLVLSLVNLYYRRWQPATRWADFAPSI